MKLTIETIFKDEELKALWHDVVHDQGISHASTMLVFYIFGGSVLYGLTMGLKKSLVQAAASSLKVFVLFFFTLMICLPTLHFIGLLFGTKTKFAHVVIVLLTGMAVTSILLGAFAPISLFFLASGTRYEFLIFMHVFFFACCGAAGLRSVKRNMLTVRQLLSPDESQTEKDSSLLLKIWFVLYMFIGTQMSYLLSPFVGKGTDFVLITHEKGDFYTYLFKILRELIMGGGY